MPAPDDTHLSMLLKRAATGDRSAFQAFYAATSARIFGLLLQMLRNRATAEDLLQETYVRIWERAWQYDPAQGAGLSWAFVTARNLAIDHMRRKRFEGAMPEDYAEVTADAGALGQVSGRVDAIALGKCLSGLDERQRDAIVLAYCSGFSYEELSDRLKAPVGTVKTWVARGLVKLRACLDTP
jgi:RNA polymerase sigma-70 factor (ECF subfamily)